MKNHVDVFSQITSRPLLRLFVLSVAINLLLAVGPFWLWLFVPSDFVASDVETISGSAKSAIMRIIKNRRKKWTFTHSPSYHIIFKLWLPNDWGKGTADKFDEVSFLITSCCNGNGLSVLLGLSRCGFWRRDEQKVVVLKPCEVVLVDSVKSADCFIDSFSSDSQIASFSFKVSWCLSHSRL